MIRRVSMIVWIILMLNPIRGMNHPNESVSSQDSEKAKIAVTYIGNEGFMVEFPSKKFLIDAITSHDNPLYTTPSKDDLKRIESGLPPFNGIDLILVTHHHLDHYSPESIANCLLDNSETTFLSTGQAVEKLKEIIPQYTRIEKQVIEVTPPFENSDDVGIHEIDVRVLRLRHSAYYEEKENGTKVNRHEDVQHLAFLIRSDGMTVYHCGDARTELDELMKFGLDEEKIDVAFLHLRFLFDPKGREIIEYLNPEYIVLMHIGPESTDRVLQALNAQKEAYQNITVFSESLQEKIFDIMKD